MAKNRSLDLYLWILDQVHATKAGQFQEREISPGTEPGGSAVDYQVLWDRLRASRLFNVPAVLMEDTYDEVAGYVGSLVRLGEEDELSPEDGTDLLIAEGCNHPFPEHLPFDHVLLLYPWMGLRADGSVLPKHMEEAASVISAGLVLDDEQLAFRYGPNVVPHLRQYGTWSVVGHLISHDGQAWEILRWTMLTLNGLNQGLSQAEIDRLPDGADIKIMTGLAATRSRDTEKWYSPLSMTPWALSAVVNMINDYKTLVIEKPKLADRMQVKKWGKKRGLKNIRPPMFYGIMLHDNVVFTESVASEFPDSSRQGYATFRSDVRGYERCRIRRGLLPMTAAERRKYVSRDYTLYEHVMDLDPEDEKRLRERGQPLKERGEWIAIKTTWVNSYMKVPEDAPYRPAIRHLPIQPPTTWEG